MNTTTVKEIAKWMMVIGGSLFTAGVGTFSVCTYIERSQARTQHKRNMMVLDKRNTVEKHNIEILAMESKAEKDRTYSAKLKRMDSKEFAKHHAEQVAKANHEVVKMAEKNVADARADVVETRLECDAKINRIQEECMIKIEKANKLRDEAKRKYEAIDTLFTNKDEVLKAKNDLEDMIKTFSKNEKDKEELLRSIKDILN